MLFLRNILQREKYDFTGYVWVGCFPTVTYSFRNAT